MKTRKIFTEKRKAFTLAETLITLTILGVVAAITIPGLVRRHVETANRTKIKKAMRSYDLAINKMVIENGTRSDDTLTAFAGNEENNCSGASNYFKIAEGSGCKFKTSDGVWWDITNIRKTIVALKEDDLNEETADSDTNRAFYFQAWFDRNGTLRVNDLAAAQDKDRLQALYDYIYGKTSTSNAAVAQGNTNNASNITLGTVSDGMVYVTVNGIAYPGYCYDCTAETPRPDYIEFDSGSVGLMLNNTTGEYELYNGGGAYGGNYYLDNEAGILSAFGYTCNKVTIKDPYDETQELDYYNECTAP